MPVDVFYITRNQYQTESKHRETFCEFFMDQKTTNGPEQHLGAQNPPLRAWGPTHAQAPRLAQVGCAPSEYPSGTSLAHPGCSGP